MPTINEALNKRTAQELYGNWVGKPAHDTLKPVPSFIAHVLLVGAFRMPDTEAGNLVNDLIGQARGKPPWAAATEITTNKGARKWRVEARNDYPATLFRITEQQ